MTLKSSDEPGRSKRTSHLGDAPKSSTSADENLGNRPRRERELIEIAVKHFHSKGYAGTSVQQIADEFGILKGSLYHYIESKEDLLFLVLSETHENLQRILEEVTNLDGLPPDELLRQYIKRQIAYTSRNLERMAIYYQEGHHLAKARRKKLDQKRESHRAFLIGLIEQLQASGDVSDDLPPGVLANVAIGSANWLYTWYQPSGSVSPDEISEACAGFILSGLTRVELTSS
jgi:AcrR family transcriptional regulator